ncbi:MAG TPA: condensation domain-containing protein, partial [Puia sp.]|nr:condensation domain-containing protein [Puia sp.]
LFAASGNPDPAVSRYPAYSEEDSLYIYFTSGSTGTPKGIVGRNGSLSQFLQWETGTFGISNKSRVSQFISPYFDAFLRDIFAPLLSGGTICIPSAERDLSSPENMIAWIDRSRISHIHCVPSLFRFFNNETLSAKNFKNLKYILLSGEKIIPAELSEWYQKFGDRIQLVNLYGATETTMIRTYHKIRPEETRQAKIPIGSPIPDTELLIAKKEFEPADALLPGSLYILSDDMTKGYLNAPELTHEKFITIPSGRFKGRAAFRTGDIARVLTNGNVELLGREDRQIKLRGIRIELDEIENVIIQSGFTKSVVTIKHEDDNGNEMLVSFVVGSGEGKKDAGWQSGLQAYLKEHLPEYMVPSNIVAVDKFPLLTSGKINQKELLDLLNVVTVVEPKNDIEENLLAIWKGILGDKSISTEDSFHRLGGNSLNMVKLMARIYKVYRVSISLSELFNHLTIRKQAVFIAKAKKDSLMVISPAETRESYHLSSAQERVYYNYGLNKTSTAFNLPMAWKIPGGFDKTKLKNAICRLIERHESLRTEFHFENGRIAQVVKETADFELEEIDGRDRNVQDVIAGFIRAFDLGKAPLIRCGLISMREGGKILVIDTHHIICDGMSQITLVSDFLKLYDREELRPLRIQYKDYAEWEYNFRSTDEYIHQREFWLKMFEDGAPKLHLPTIQPDKVQVVDSGGNVAFDVDKEMIYSIIRALAEENITIFSVLFSIFSVFMAQLTGQQDILIGTNASGRVQDELEEVVGMFTKTLPVRCRVGMNLSFKQFAAQMHKALVETYNRQLYDLADIVNELNNKRIPFQEGLIEVMFVYQNYTEEKFRKENDHKLVLLDLERRSAKYPISLFGSEVNHAFKFRWEYSPDYFTKPDIELLIGQFKSLLELIAANPDTPMNECVGKQEQSPVVAEEHISFNF